MATFLKSTFQHAPFLTQSQAVMLGAFEQLAAEGLLDGPIARGLGVAPGTQLQLLDGLRLAGSRNLSLGRLYEGHLNALLLIQRYGDGRRAADALAEGRIFGVWNTDGQDRVTVQSVGNCLRFSGRKAFGSGAGIVERPIVTAEWEGRGRVMCLLPMEALSAEIDRESWKPLGMENSDSFTVDFDGVEVGTEVILGAPGDYYREPFFTAGALRFAAVQLGGAERLAACFVEWLIHQSRAGDSFQRARAGEIEILLESGRQWIAQGAAVAEECLHAPDQMRIGRMVHFANMARLAIERICLDVMERVTRGVGARGLLQPFPFADLLKDLTMYLRQPNPDGALMEIGRWAIDQHPNSR